MVMKSFVLIFLMTLTTVISEDAAKNNGTRYAFYRNIAFDSPGETRRVFGGAIADIVDYPAAAALLDRFWNTRCSGSVITPYWVLTAAHCVTSRVAFIKYNTRHPSSKIGSSAEVLYLYRHPNYKVVQEDEGRGMDVTLLHHDLGLIRSRDKMELLSPLQPLSAMRRFNPADIEKQELIVVGFGRTEYSPRSSGEELFEVKLKMVHCDRDSWYHCMCATAPHGISQRGVCSGDSGGPVMYHGVQVGVTSMGPTECASSRSDPAEGATSVFTSTYHYVDIINATITDADFEYEQQMKRQRLRKSARSASDILRFYPLLVTLSVLPYFLL